MESTSVKNQYLAAATGEFVFTNLTNLELEPFELISVNIIAVGVGASIGWASPSLPFLQSDETILSEPLSSEEASWVGSLLALGALFGTLLFGWLSETIGRFWATLLTAIPQLVRELID
jgi:MFS family permease